MTDALPLRQFDATDPKALAAWIADVHQRYPEPEQFDEVMASVIGRLGREYAKLSAIATARGRGQRQGGSEAFSRQETIAWAERAEERVGGAGEAPPDGAPGSQDSSSPGDVAGDMPEDGSASNEGSGAEPIVKPKPNRGHRQAFPASWKRETIVLPVGPDGCPCEICNAEKAVIGHVVSEVLAIEPARLYVKQYQREKRACTKGHAGVITAPPEPRLVEASACDLSVSLDLVDRKIVQHLPIHRVQEIYARLGCDVAPSTLERWYHDVLRAFRPVAAAIRAAATSPERFLVNIDDTSLPILDRDAAEGRLIGHLWLVVGDGRFVSASASPDWTKEHAAAALGDYTGYVQCDAYRGFDHLFKTRPLVEVACWAHARRYFVKAKDRGSKDADEALGLIGQLFGTESRARDAGLDAEGRLALRRERSRRTLDLLWKWTAKLGRRTPPKSPLGRGLTYLANQRRALERFLEDGRLPLENTVVEREMRPIALGRKNWLFAGSLAAAKRLADGLTVVSTARMHDVDPVAYIRWLLPQLARREWSVEAAGAHLLPSHFQESLK